MENNPKIIRNKMYLWVQGKGVNLTKQDRKEIKDIMEEYAGCSKTNPIERIKPQKIVSDWKPYPEHSG